MIKEVVTCGKSDSTTSSSQVVLQVEKVVAFIEKKAEVSIEPRSSTLSKDQSISKPYEVESVEPCFLNL